jgi:hypothetical protein
MTGNIDSILLVNHPKKGCKSATFEWFTTSAFYIDCNSLKLDLRENRERKVVCALYINLYSLALSIFIQSILSFASEHTTINKSEKNIHTYTGKGKKEREKLSKLSLKGIEVDFKYI